MVTADSRVVATVQGESLDDAWVAPMAALGSAKPITSHGSLNDPTWSPDGRIVYCGGVDGNIWVMGSDGSNPKQLTSNAEEDFSSSLVFHRTAITCSSIGTSFRWGAPMTSQL